jgi:NADPH:quinone reductase-like Zn-dependent oxidoreductase
MSYARGSAVEKIMKAAIYENYGPPEVVHLRQVPKPVPADDEVLVRIRATTVSSGDWRARSLEMPPGFGLLGRLVMGMRGPRRRILGTELAGTIEAVGRNVTSFRPGDHVFGFPGGAMGSHAEYRCLPAEGRIALKPASLTFEQAAALSFGGMTALDFFRRGRLKAGERVLVNGASGAVGSAAVQIARHLGAHVTAVCGSANAARVKGLGADVVIDYRVEDFAAARGAYDIIVDCAGNAPYSRVRNALREHGRLLVVLGGLGAMFAPLATLGGSHKVVSGPAAERVEDFKALARLAADGVFKPLIDEVFPFERIVDAHRRVDSGHKRGSVVVALPAAA